ncbi:MAG: YgjV family protein [Clostridia bacterium]|nr:YgjV family protein [Clostridia bacterium]
MRTKPENAKEIVTISYYITNPMGIRAIALISSPLCLVYNLVNHSLGTILAEIFSILSSLIGIMRYNERGNS